MNEPAASITTELRDAVLRVLRDAASPLSTPQVRSALPKQCRAPAPELRQALDSLVASGEAHAWGTAKTPKYWSRTRSAVIGERILSALRLRAMTGSELRKLARCTAAELKPQIDALVKQGKVREHPPVKGRTPVYGLDAPDPSSYLDKVRKELDALCSRLEPHGVTREEVLRAVRGTLGGAAASASQAPPADLPSRIFDILRLARDRGVLAISLLRRLFNRQKPEFDAAVLDLHARGLVILHRHDGPHTLPPEERYELVDDGRGAFYVGIALR